MAVDWNNAPVRVSQRLPNRLSVRMPFVVALFKLADEFDAECGRFLSGEASPSDG